MSSFYISAAHKSSGKTTLSIGIAAAIRQRGLNIQTFKKGPDYIDPIWLGQASGLPCYNLDFFTSSHNFILNQFNQYKACKDVVLVEGNMGLFDGMAVDGSDSNAAMAKLLRIPVVLVIDTQGTSRGIAPLLTGYQSFDENIRYAGVILNKVAGNRHQSKLTNVINEYTDFNILGCVPRNTDIQVTERHLGLIPGNEMPEESDRVIELLATQASEFIDLDSLLSLKRADQPDHTADKIVATTNLANPEKIRIAIPFDQSFGFYYPGDIEKFASLGVEVIHFDCLKDTALPDNIDGLFIGGGFPETQVEALSANTAMLKSIRSAIQMNLPTYAECGGLMYLCKELTYQGNTYPLCHVISASVDMHKRPQGRGYVILESTTEHPWFSKKNTTINAHEFHYSAIQGLAEDTKYAYTVKRGTGIDKLNDGIIQHNMIASYTHLRQTDQCSWVDNFVAFVKNYRKQRIDRVKHD